MLVTVKIDDALYNEAMEWARVTQKETLINEMFRDFISVDACQGLLELADTGWGWDNEEDDVKNAIPASNW
jgi:Arc/MetJ family transcription regulator